MYLGTYFFEAPRKALRCESAILQRPSPPVQKRGRWPRAEAKLTECMVIRKDSFPLEETPRWRPHSYWSDQLHFR